MSEGATSQEPIWAERISARPISEEPTSAEPISDGRATEEPASGEPISAWSTSEEPASAQPISAWSTSEEPASAQPISAWSTSEEPASAGPASADESSYAGHAPPPANRWPLGRIAGVVGIAGAVAAVGVAAVMIARDGAAHRPTSQAESAPAVALQTSGSSAPAAPPPAASAGPPVRFKNPFDRSEVFEFPPGTSKAEARRWVANMLLERARDRHPPSKATRRAGGGRAGPGRPAERTDLAANTARAAR